MSELTERLLAMDDGASASGDHVTCYSCRSSSALGKEASEEIERLTIKLEKIEEIVTH